MQSNSFPEPFLKLYQVNVSKSTLSFMMSCPWRNHQNRLKSSHYFMYSMYFTCIFRELVHKNKTKNNNSNKPDQSLSMIKTNNGWCHHLFGSWVGDSSLLFALTMCHCQLLYNYSGPNWLKYNLKWQLYFNKNKPSPTRKINKSFKSECCFHFCLWLLF